jgi:hypothetical protein
MIPANKAEIVPASLGTNPKPKSNKRNKMTAEHTETYIATRKPNLKTPRSLFFLDLLIP